MSPVCLLLFFLKLTSIRVLLPSSPPKQFLSSSLKSSVLLNITGTFHGSCFLIYQQHLTESITPSLKSFLRMASRTQNSGGFLLYQRLLFHSFFGFFSTHESKYWRIQGSACGPFLLPRLLHPSGDLIQFFFFFNLCLFTDKAQVFTLSLDLFCTSTCLLDTSTWMSI